MKFTKTIELDIQHLQPYIIEDIPGKLVINNQSDGLYILTNTLSPWKNIHLVKQNITIEQIYKKKDGTELLLYCPKNENLIHVSLTNFESAVISLPQECIYKPLLPLYFWDDIECLLTTSEQFYRINFDQMILEPAPLTVERDEHHHPTFYQCWKKYHTSDIISFDQDGFMVATRTDDTVTVDLFFQHYRSHHHPVLTFDDTNIQDVQHSDGTLLLITPNHIDVVNISAEKKDRIAISDPYIFKAARFLEDSHSKFVTLCDDANKEGQAQLQLYEIAPDSAA